MYADSNRYSYLLFFIFMGKKSKNNMVDYSCKDSALISNPNTKKIHILPNLVTWLQM